MTARIIPIATALVLAAWGPAALAQSSGGGGGSSGGSSGSAGCSMGMGGQSGGSSGSARTQQAPSGTLSPGGPASPDSPAAMDGQGSQAGPGPGLQGGGIAPGSGRPRGGGGGQQAQIPEMCQGPANSPQCADIGEPTGGLGDRGISRERQPPYGPSQSPVQGGPPFEAPSGRPLDLPREGR